MLGNQPAGTMSKVLMRPLAPREAEWNTVCKLLTRLMSDLGKWWCMNSGMKTHLWRLRCRDNVSSCRWKGFLMSAWFPCYTFELNQGVVTKLGYKTRKHQRRKVRSKTKTMLSSNVDNPHYKGISWYPNFGAAVWNKSKYFARWASADDWDKYSKTLQNSRKSLEKKTSLKAWKNPAIIWRKLKKIWRKYLETRKTGELNHIQNFTKFHR